jgi:4-hydroxybenzoate polyprenyltransferase
MRKTKLIINVFRPLRWYRNLFMLLGSLIAIKLNNLSFLGPLLSIIIVFLAICLVASGNYGINEAVDADSDAYHPDKKNRAIPSGEIGKFSIIVISIILYILGFVVIFTLHNKILCFSLFLLFVSGMFYNIPPFRLKDVFYVDFIFEALNNPIRLLVGWYAVTSVIVPASLLFAFWFFGIFLMAAKRFAEIRSIDDLEKAGLYRKSLKYYTEEKLLFAMIGSVSAFMFMLGVLAIKHQINLVIMLPLLIIFIIWFFKLAYEKDSIVKDPEKIFKKKAFLWYSTIITIICIFLFYYPLGIFDFLKK